MGAIPPAFGNKYHRDFNIPPGNTKFRGVTAKRYLRQQGGHYGYGWGGWRHPEADQARDRKRAFLAPRPRGSFRPQRRDRRGRFS